MRIHVLCFIALLSAHLNIVQPQLSGILDYTSKNIKNPETVRKEWEKLESTLKDVVNKVLKTLMPGLIENMVGLNISTSCTREALQVIGGIKRLQPWAMRFLDSSAKGIDGGMTATLFAFGAYDECLDTVARNQHTGMHKGETMFTGKYCMLRIKPYLPLQQINLKLDEIIEELKELYEKDTVVSTLAKYAPYFYYSSFRVGLCVPSGCSVDDINQMFKKVSSATGLYMYVKRCEVKEETKFTPLMISVMCVYSFAGMIVLLGTLTDVYYYYSSKQKPNSALSRVLFAFSFLSNFRKLVTTSKERKNIRCLNGIRFLSMSWVILGHTYMFLASQVVSGMEYAIKFLSGFTEQAIVNGTFSVETFFFLGGFLVCYHATNYVKRSNKTLNVKLYVLLRLWRILPIYTFVILFTFLLPLLSSGPQAYNVLRPFSESCKEIWWSRLLFISNFYQVESLCVPHGWYLSVDMQLYIGGLIILLPLFRWPKIGVSIAFVSAAAFMIATGVVTYMKSLPPVAGGDLDMQKGIEFYYDYISKPYCHAGSYIIGIMVGYLLAMHPKLKIPKVVLVFGWLAAVLLASSVLYGTYEWNGGREATMLETIFYSSCGRIAWSMSIAWMVICCATGYGGVINYILSWKMWIPLARLTFVTYLAHPYILTALIAHERRGLVPKHVVPVWLFFGHLMATYGVAFAGSMLIEAPFMSLRKLIFAQHGDRRLKNENEKAITIQTVLEASKEINADAFYVSQKRKGADNPDFVTRL